MSSLHNKTNKEKLGRWYIDFAFDFTKHDDKVRSICDIKGFLKTYKNTDIIYNIGGIDDNQITLSNEQNYVLDICKSQLEEI